MIEEFKVIIHNNQTEKLLHFLKKLTAKEKKELAKELQNIWDKSEKKNKNIYIATALACCTKKQYHTYTNVIEGEKLSELVDEVLDWKRPAWLSKYYNTKTTEEWNWGLPNYSTILRWQQKGYILPSPQLIAKTLVHSYSQLNHTTQKMQSQPDVLETHPITLDEHIWTIFRNESGIEFRDSYFATKNKEEIWKKTFKKYIDSKRIDKIQVLKSCLLTAELDFKRKLSGWFADLFDYIEPIEEELLQVQEELFIAFMSKHTKMVNKSLDAIKKIAAHKAFQTEHFISELPRLLTSETKRIVTSTLGILEQIAKARPEKREAICTTIPQVFLNKDESIQKKTAKIITKYSNPESETIQSAIQTYAGSILMSVKTKLQPYLENTEPTHSTPPNDHTSSIALETLNEEQRISTIETVDDFLFFMPQVFGNKEPYYRELLPATLIKLNGQINESNIDRLKIPLKKAYKVLENNPFTHVLDSKTKKIRTVYFWGKGLFYSLAALLFVNYCQYLAKKYPKVSGYITDMHIQATKADKKRYFSYKRQVVPQKEWIGKKYKIFRPHYLLSLQTLNYIEQEIELPLLSTPTHTPAWIDPIALIERLIQYQSVGILPGKTDLDMALTRCPQEHISKLLERTDKELEEKYKEPILSYFIGTRKKSDKKSFSPFFKEKTPYTRNMLIEHTQKYAWKISDKKETDATWTEHPTLEVNLPESPWEKEECLYSCIADNIRYCIGPTDIKQFILSYPNIPAIPYAQITKDRFVFAQMADSETRDYLQDAITLLHELKVELNGITLLFLTCCLICSEKNIRNYATEIWLERTSAGMLNQKELGEIIGQLEKSEWAPLKRLTDLIVSNLLGITEKHNRALEQMIISILPQIEKPVTNLKKLLEIYKELLALNHSKPDRKVLSQLKKWESENNLKRIIKEISK